MSYTVIPGVPGKLITGAINDLWDKLCIAMGEQVYIGSPLIEEDCNNMLAGAFLLCPMCVEYCSDSNYCSTNGAIYKDILIDDIAHPEDPNFKWAYENKAAIVSCYNPSAIPINYNVTDESLDLRKNAYINLCSYENNEEQISTVVMSSVDITQYSFDSKKPHTTATSLATNYIIDNDLPTKDALEGVNTDALIVGGVTILVSLVAISIGIGTYAYKYMSKKHQNYNSEDAPLNILNNADNDNYLDSDYTLISLY